MQKRSGGKQAVGETSSTCETKVGIETKVEMLSSHCWRKRTANMPGEGGCEQGEGEGEPRTEACPMAEQGEPGEGQGEPGDGPWEGGKAARLARPEAGSLGQMPAVSRGTESCLTVESREMKVEGSRWGSHLNKC